MNKIAIIGAGASGLCCAIMLKHKKNDIEVCVYESSDRVGKKLAVTGNGRCNISNTNLSTEKYHGDENFAIEVISQFDYNEQKNFFEILGVPFITEGEGKAYPMSLQATSVVDALRFEAEDLGIKILLNSKIESVIKSNDQFQIIANGHKNIYDCVVIATGGKAGKKSPDTSGYDILKRLGHKIEPLFPSLVQVKTETDIVKQLKGIKIKGKATISFGEDKKEAFGEILFCDYGLSGPAILQISRNANQLHSKIHIDILPDFSKDELIAIIKKRVEHSKDRPACELFTGFMNKRLGQVILKLSGCNINNKCSDITNIQIERIASNIKAMKFNVVGTTGFENAQVTAGGAQTAQFFSTLMSKKVKGLFAIGEILNVDGDCGGYNLAFAWASAFVASNGIVEFLSKRK